MVITSVPADRMTSYGAESVMDLEAGSPGAIANQESVPTMAGTSTSSMGGCVI